MLYLLDANVLIEPHELYYPVDRIPQYWDWLLEICESGAAKIPHEIYGEVQPADGPFKEWLRASGTPDRLALQEDADPALVTRVLEEGYGPNLSAEELVQPGQDPFLIAYALNGNDRTVVSQEVSRRSKKRGNRKVPDVCSDLGVPCINAFDLFRILDFHTR